MHSLNVKTVLFQTILFSINTMFSSIWPINRTLSGAITPDQSRPGRNGNEEVLCIPQSSSITGNSPSDCLVLYSKHSLGGVLSLSSKAVSIIYSPNWLENRVGGLSSIKSGVGDKCFNLNFVNVLRCISFMCFVSSGTVHLRTRAIRV